MNGLWGRPLAATGLALAITGCGAAAPPAPSDSNAFEVRKLPAAIEPYARPVVEANTRFALDLYANLRSRPGNLFFSPFSTSLALAMTQAGTAGITRAEMDQVLHFAGVEQLHSAQGAVIASLDRGGNLGGYRLTTAAAVWVSQAPVFIPPISRSCGRIITRRSTSSISCMPPRRRARASTAGSRNKRSI